MEIIVLKEVGYEESLLGLSLSHKDRAIPMEEWWTPEKFEKMKKVAAALAGRGGGHDKFLESITVYLNIEAPRYWWSEFDTYRAGITKQSESTMHTLKKRDITFDDVANDCPTDAIHLSFLFDYINDNRGTGISVQEIKQLIPESYLQRRIVVTNYKTLRNIYQQRLSHKLPEWQVFCKRIKESLHHPEFITKEQK